MTSNIKQALEDIRDLAAKVAGKLDGGIVAARRLVVLAAVHPGKTIK
jgi:hypothetical protein